MNSNIMTEEDLMELAGRRKRTALVKWLVTKHIAHWINAEGKVVSTVQAVNRALTGEVSMTEVNEV